MGRADAEATFNSLIEESDHFAPFAHFYLGSMLMLDFEDMRKEQQSVLLESSDGGYKVDADGATAMFKRARVLLGEQRARREEEVIYFYFFLVHLANSRDMSFFTHLAQENVRVKHGVSHVRI